MPRPKEDEDTVGIDYGHRFMRGGGGIPLPPKPRNPNPAPPSGGGGSNSGGGTSGTPGGRGSGGRGSGSSSGGGNSYADYIRQQKAEQRRAEAKAARRYVTDAEALRGQANALLTLLGRRPIAGGGKGRGDKGGNGGKGHPFGDDMVTDVGGRGKDGGRSKGPTFHMASTKAGSKGKDDMHTPHKGGKDKGGKKHPGREGDLMDERETKLANQRRAYLGQDSLLLEQFDERLGALRQSAEDNESAADTQAIAALSNRQRERANALSEISLQGGGESDLLRAQQMALRNYQANAQEVNRNYQDSLSSINASMTDLTADTKTARMSALSQYNSDRELIWTNFYDAKSEAETQLGNTYGQMAEYYGLANEQRGSKKYRRRQKRLTKRSDAAFMDAAHTAAQAWKAPVDTRIAKWEGAADVESALNNNVFAGAGTELSDKPEGATLRRWDA